MANPEFLSDSELREVYEWVDTFDLSRIKRNINRDFCDVVLVSEILNFYHPKLVDLHNYSLVHSQEEKVANWQLLRKKVLDIIEFSLDDDEIISIVNSEKGTIEIFLLRLKRFLEQKAFEQPQQVQVQQRKNTDIKDQVRRLRMGNTIEKDFDENEEKAKIQNGLYTTIDLLQMKIDKLKMVSKVKADKIKVLENKLREQEEIQQLIK